MDEFLIQFMDLGLALVLALSAIGSAAGGAGAGEEFPEAPQIDSVVARRMGRGVLLVAQVLEELVERTEAPR